MSFCGRVGGELDGAVSMQHNLDKYKKRIKDVVCLLKTKALPLSIYKNNINYEYNI